MKANLSEIAVITEKQENHHVLTTVKKHEIQHCVIRMCQLPT